MDSLVLEKKIDSILRCIERIQSRTPTHQKDFLSDYDAQDVIILNISRIVQLAVDIAIHILSSTNQSIPATMSEAFSHLEKREVITHEVADKMKKSVGYRNVAVHSYDEVDLSITFDIAQQHLQDFKHFIKQILDYQEVINKQ